MGETLINASKTKACVCELSNKKNLPCCVFFMGLRKRLQDGLAVRMQMTWKSRKIQKKLI